MMKNYVKFTFYFTLLLIAFLQLLHYLPSLTVFGHELRPVDLFADIRVSEVPEEPEDEISDIILPVPKPEFADTCKTGITCIEDYGDSTGYGMKKFYETLSRRNEMNRPVRIAVFGDSFIEGDIFTSDLRSLLQDTYGGCGVGFVPVTSSTYSFRPTVIHSFNGWRSHLQTDSAYFNRKNQGISSSYFIPRNNAYVELRGQNKYGHHLDTCEIATIYFRSANEVEVKSTVNKADSEVHHVIPDTLLHAFQVEGSIHSVRWTINKAEGAFFYGTAMDGKRGISLDNFSLRGSNGISLKWIPEQTLKEFNRLRPYDLIVLQYGLNVATQYGRDYDYYRKGLLTTIEHLKNCFPDAGILLLSVSDRNYKTSSGDYRTMPGVKNLLLYQQAVSMESGIAFWNLFEAMGGEESMAELVNSNPSKANLDYSHINFRGGKYLAELLAGSLIYGKEQYDRRKEYEE